jgi:hypothetical protein
LTPDRVKALEGIGFVWKPPSPSWEDRLIELADYRNNQGHCNISKNYSENTKLADWVGTQRKQYKLHLAGKASSMTLSRIQALEDIGFEWDSHGAAWGDRLSDLADYRRIHGHFNVPRNNIENTKLANWVTHQRREYRLHVKEMSPRMTKFRIQKFESLGFEWDSLGAAFEDHLSELADYRKIHGRCNVPKKYSENAKLATWVTTQRKQYVLHVKGKPSHMTLPRIQALESLTFDWKPSSGWGKGTPKKPSLDDDAARLREVIWRSTAQKYFSGKEICCSQVPVAFEAVSSSGRWRGVKQSKRRKSAVASTRAESWATFNASTTHGDIDGGLFAARASPFATSWHSSVVKARACSTRFTFSVNAGSGAKTLQHTGNIGSCLVQVLVLARTSTTCSSCTSIGTRPISREKASRDGKLHAILMPN